MKRLCASLYALVLLSVLSSLPPTQAQSSPAETRAIETRTMEPYYDIAKEVTLTGTVSTVLTRPSAGMIAGSHLVLATASGEVDASLGRWGLQGKGGLSVAAGEQVEVTGVHKTLKGRQVFVVRTVKADGQVYTMRNQHGIPVSPQARERASAKPAQKGDSL
ncbi:MAG: hypothetical protein ABSC07_14770 [Terriglobales bacterium]|jgi:hypothetical protein